jgi:hypothetical protein
MAVATATLQSRVTGMHPRTPATPTLSFARTPALRDKTNLLDYGNTEDRNIYEDGRSSVLSRDKFLDATAEQLMPFINALNMRATDMGWNDTTNPQQITPFDIPHHGATVQINLVTSYGCISLTDLRKQCARFMIGSDANQRASQNNQMLQECIWNSITPLVQRRLEQYETEYTLGHHLCGPLLLKVIIRMSTMDSRATISILQAKLNNIASYAIGVSGDVEKITAYFTKNVSQIKAAGASVSDPVDIVFKGLLAVPCKEFCRYIGNKEDLYYNGSLTFTAEELVIMAQQKIRSHESQGHLCQIPDIGRGNHCNAG